MLPDDPRHGEYRGAVAHWLDGERPCEPCAVAETRYRKRRKLRHLRGEAVTVPAVGPARRIKALMALGWSGQQIADEAGLSLATLRSIGYHESVTIHAKTANAIGSAYERLCMVPPVGAYAGRARRMAARKGWVPPLAWDDIDDPDEVPSGLRKSWHNGPGLNDYDETVVQRILTGDWRLRSTAAEKREVVRRWTGDFNELARLTGWKVERYTDRGAA